MVRALSPVEGDALGPQVPKDKAGKLVDALNRELKSHDLWAAWIYCTPSDESCWKTASALQKELEKSLPAIVEQDFLYAGRLEETDKWTRKMTGHPNSFILVAQQQFTDVYPAHFWQSILKRKGSVVPLREGEAVSFTADGPEKYSCTLLS